jgi:hypothetical protein
MSPNYFAKILLFGEYGIIKEPWAYPFPIGVTQVP